MKQGILESIEGLSGENLTTAVLAHIIRNANKKLLHYLTHENIVNYKITNQKTIPNGRFDLYIESDDCVAVIENKFFATFTYSQNIHQLERYFNWIKNQDFKYRKLICLSVESRRKEINNILKNLNRDSIEAKFISWEDIIELLDAQSEVQRELKYFIKNRYLNQIILHQQEIDIMFNKESAESYTKIIQMVDRVKELIKDDAITIKGNAKYESGAYGFYFKISRSEYWFGFDPDFWLETGVPLDLQLRNTNKNKDERFNYSSKNLFGTHVVFTADEVKTDTSIVPLIKTLCIKQERRTSAST